jgi:hypothetical protein
MTPAELLQAAMLGIVNYNNAITMDRTLTEFEMLAYEQSFRTYEAILKNYREALEKSDEPERTTE